MKIKVCGMRDKRNVEELVKLGLDYIGFIFYHKSERFVGDDFPAEITQGIPQGIKRVGVFVNASPSYIIDTVKKYHLHYAQLHGNEMPDLCRNIKQKGINIIKAFTVDETFNFAILNNYKPHCDLFLFDAKGENPGGNGVPFDWQILSRYDREKPFFIAGGIGPENITAAAELANKTFVYGIDLNSRFETSAGLKDIAKLSKALAGLRKITKVAANS